MGEEFLVLAWVYLAIGFAGICWLAYWDRRTR